MKWCRKLRRKFDPPPVSRAELVQAREEADADTARTAEVDKQVRDIVARLRRQRTENHFGPLIWAALRGESDV
ncbi:DUF7620 family protein [Nocardiopsis tropica]|uniref:Uncharacterized protein n=1 Tax=Nocardiopsis tropica TaxID=109330 RepID=A0ABU7KR07_9ACTN|nr:hypothetical protein [Nocardiopsis umidischolae]MEE2051711.1 hypothetical protein [Nocardiopsis umidischolae]